MTISEKNELLDNMSICYNRINYLKIISEEKSQPDMTAQLERRKNRLKIEIDGLLQDLYASWIGDAAQIKTNITNTNKELNRCIAEIEKDINFAQNIIKALGYVDDVIKVAADLVP